MRVSESSQLLVIKDLNPPWSITISNNKPHFYVKPPTVPNILNILPTILWIWNLYDRLSPDTITIVLLGRFKS